MFGSKQFGVNAYAKVGVETGVSSASPHQLVVMLFDGAMKALGAAIVNMKANNIAAKGEAISKAILIIDSGLRASLDKKAGGEIAEGLDSLYEYMGNRLLLANLKNDVAILEEVQKLLGDLRSAWNAIGSSPAVQPAPAAAPRGAAVSPLTYASA
jgi:flagellar protein FliS